MAAVHMSMNSLDLALQTLDSVLAVEPINEKAIMRKGKVLSLRGENVAAARELKRALQINPNNKTVQNILSNVEAALVKERAQERELYKKMLGQKDKNEKPKDSTEKTVLYFIICLIFIKNKILYFYFRYNSISGSAKLKFTLLQLNLIKYECFVNYLTNIC